MITRAVTFPVVLHCMEPLESCENTTTATDAILGSGLIRVDPPEGWYLGEEERERSSHPRIDDEEDHFTALCPEHAPRRRP